jgi:hypothetical protein
MWMSARSKAIGAPGSGSQSQSWFHWIAETRLPHRLPFLGIGQPHLLLGFSDIQT